MLSTPEEPCALTTFALINFLKQWGPHLERMTLSCTTLWCFQELMQRTGAMTKEQTPLTSGRSWNAMRTLDLRIDVDGGFWNEEDVRHTDIFRRLPSSLTHLHLNPAPYDALIDRTWTPLPLSSPTITALTLTMHWIFLCADLCVNLQSLTFDLCQGDVNWGTKGIWVGATSSVVKSCYTLPRLHTLHLKRFPDRYSTTTVLTRLSAPCLSDLDISFDCPPSNPSDGENADYPEFSENMVQFLHSNSGGTNTIRRLRIHGIALPWTAFQSVFETVPSVTHLILDGVSFESESHKSRLVWTDTLFPFLHTLEMLQADDTLDCQSILSFAQARCKKFRSQGSDSLRRLKISMLDNPTFYESARWRSAVRTLRQKGVDVEVVWEPPVS